MSATPNTANRAGRHLIEPHEAARYLAEVGLDAQALGRLRALHGRVAADLDRALDTLDRFVARALGETSATLPEFAPRLSLFFRRLLECRVDPDAVDADLTLWREIGTRADLRHFAPSAFSRFERAVCGLQAATEDGGQPPLALLLSHFSRYHLALINDFYLEDRARAFRQTTMRDRGTGLPNGFRVYQGIAGQIAGKVANDGSITAIIRVEVRFPVADESNSRSAIVDSVMQAYAERLAQLLRGNDLVGRTGRFEFTLVFDALRSEGHALLAGQRVMQILRKPLRHEGSVISANPCVGIALHPAHGNDVDSLLDHLTLALEVARRNVARIALYSDQSTREDAMLRTREHDLQTALADNELMLYYHPQVELSSGRLVGSEALLRWCNRHGDWIPPLDIVAAAESGGMMPQLTSWTLNTAMREWVELSRQGVDAPISVNLTAQDLRDPEFEPGLKQSIETWGIAPDRIVLEITEGSMIENVDQTLDLLNRLRDSGFHLAIDDFGTGYSSLAYLRKMPTSELKIDQSFVRNMLHDHSSERIVRSVIDLAHNLGMHTVADGVENAETAAALRHLGCDRIQGYFLTRPVPTEVYLAWAQSWSPETVTSL